MAQLSRWDVEHKLQVLGYVLPEAMQTPNRMKLPFPWVKIIDNRALISGHLPLKTDGSLAHPLGKVGKDLTIEQGYEAAKQVGLAILGSLKRELGDLNRITQWVRILGMVNCAEGFQQHPAVINGFTDLILAVFGPDIGFHARSAVGFYELPFGVPVEIEGELYFK
jgi:enamine deaminase RidA (YjgF/YER057c/UK114 family)